MNEGAKNRMLRMKLEALPSSELCHAIEDRKENPRKMVTVMLSAIALMEKQLESQRTMLELFRSLAIEIIKEGE